MALVDTLDEQTLLEQLIEESKPAVPADCRDLHYLLSTPFRYGAPYPSGSRFRRAGLTPGVFYASSSISTAVAEMSFRRLLFFAESPATPWPANAVDHTAFSVRFATRQGHDLTSPHSTGTCSAGPIRAITARASHSPMRRARPGPRCCGINRRARTVSTWRC